ncbi:FKBP-type peptidyl-prolyl cis-trans isomerase [Polaribacter sp.]|uniref:FKBP-type peptidyl-prolyl cis-trans isomerase n=1 Tax=Polaribacter sp. TaxID=1920175 RepID=UPI003F6D2E02
MKKIFLLLFVNLLFGCSSDENFDAQNEIDIQAYIQENNLDIEKTNSGLYYNIKTVGSGEFPSVNSNVTVSYKGYLLDGDIFDQSSNATFNLTGVIPGFSEAVQLLKKDGSGTFILPSRLGYGNKGSGKIKGGDVIVFEVRLIRIN